MMLTDLAFPPAWRTRAAAAAQALLDHDNYLVAAHVRLDGDAVSSMVAMALFLEQKNRRYALFAPFGVPDKYDCLPLPSPVHKSLAALPFAPRTLIALDCNVTSRLGEELCAAMEEPGELGELSCINIDHHPGQGMGSIVSVIQPAAASSTQILASVLREAGADFTPELATALALGLVADTGGFRHANCTPEVFALAAFLETRGASVHKLRECLEKNWTMARMGLWGYMSENVALSCHDRLAVCSLSLDVLEGRGCSGEDTEGFVEHMRELRSVDVACFVREQNIDVCKFSLRSAEDVDVNAIASLLGGGGHRNAAGGTLVMSLERARQLLERTIRQHLGWEPDETA